MLKLNSSFASNCPIQVQTTEERALTKKRKVSLRVGHGLRYYCSKRNKTNPRTWMHYVYLCHARLSTSLVNDSCQGRESATFSLLTTALVNDCCQRREKTNVTWRHMTWLDLTWLDLTWNDGTQKETGCEKTSQRDATQEEIDTRRATRRDMKWHIWHDTIRGWRLSTIRVNDYG